jgi:2-methylfumaryl-CoA isomerase
MYDMLKGMTVVEGSAFIAAPSCGLYLAQFGAEVIRFDNIGGGPDYNRWPLAPGSGDSLFWEAMNKGKKSIALDLSRPEGREVAARLSASTGLFVTNYPVDGFLSYARLKALRDDLICLRVMGWPDGRPAVDYTVNAAVGVPMITGPIDYDGPINHVLPAWDLLTGAYAAFALMAADRNRGVDGLGREVRLPLSDMAAVTMGNLGRIGEAVSAGERPKMGNDLYGGFSRDYLLGDGRRVMIFALTPRPWRGLLKALDLVEAVKAVETRLGADFDKEADRFIHRAHLHPLVEARLGALTVEQAGAALDASGVTWSLYQTMPEALTHGDPQLFSANPVFTPVAHPSGYSYLTPGPAAEFVGLERHAAGPAPRLGQDTDEVLATRLGLSSGEIARLHDQGVVAGPVFA